MKSRWCLRLFISDTVELWVPQEYEARVYYGSEELLHKTCSSLYLFENGASVAKELGLLTLSHLPLTDLGLNLVKDYGFFHVKKLSS